METEGFQNEGKGEEGKRSAEEGRDKDGGSTTDTGIADRIITNLQKIINRNHK